MKITSVHMYKVYVSKEFLYFCAVLRLASVAQSCPTLCDPMDCSPPGPSVHGDSPSRNTGVGCHALLQGHFLTQGSNLCLLHCRRFFTTEPPGKPVNQAYKTLMYSLINTYKVSNYRNVTLIEEWEIIRIHVLLPSTRHFPLQKDYGLRTPGSSL